MSHGIQIAEDGRATAAYLETAAWHHLGEVVATSLAADEMLRIANMADLDYHLEPLVVAMGGDLVDTGMMTTVRRDPFTDLRHIVGGYLSKDYALETPEMFMEFIDLLTEGGVEIASIGLVNEGRRMFVSLKMTDLMLGGVDRTSQYLLGTTGFDGSQASVLKLVNFRIDCANMLNMALGTKSEYTFTARHTSALIPKIDLARNLLDIAWKSTEKFNAEAERMIEQDVTDRQFAKMVEEFVPLDKDASQAKETRVLDARNSIDFNWRFGNAASINGTAWGALNALTEFVDHQQGNKKDADQRALDSFLNPRFESERARARKVVDKVLLAV